MFIYACLCLKMLSFTYFYLTYFSCVYMKCKLFIYLSFAGTCPFSHFDKWLSIAALFSATTIERLPRPVFLWCWVCWSLHSECPAKPRLPTSQEGSMSFTFAVCTRPSTLDTWLLFSHVLLPFFLSLSPSAPEEQYCFSFLTAAIHVYLCGVCAGYFW